MRGEEKIRYEYMRGEEKIRYEYMRGETGVRRYVREKGVLEAS